jgi:hypothetical protein
LDERPWYTDVVDDDDLRFVVTLNARAGKGIS